MDKDNDGLDPVELLEFIQGNQEDSHMTYPDTVVGDGSADDFLLRGALARGQEAPRRGPLNLIFDRISSNFIEFH